MRFKSYSVAACLLVGVMSCSTNATDFTWPDNVKAAVSLSYDDAVTSQLDNAVPALDRHNLKATFYLSPTAPTFKARMQDWRAAAQAGHELGNHSLFHQCSRALEGREWVKPDHDLDKISIPHFKDQLKLANTLLMAIDGQTERTFTAPCIDTRINGEDYIAHVKELFVAIKGSTDSEIDNMATLDVYRVGVEIPEEMTGKELIALVKKAGERGTMINFTFHGIGGDYLAVSNEAHNQLLAFLDKNRKVYWTDTFLNIMRHVKAEQQRIGS